MKRLLGVLFGPVVLRVIGALAVAALVWWGGPLLAIGPWHPLDPEWARWATIAVVLLAWFGRRVVGALRDRLRNRRFLSAIAPAPAAAESEAQAANRARFEQAVATLRNADFDGAGARGPRWLRGSRHVYQLPWYLLIGPPGSGKTTALMHSGLQFPLSGQVGQDPLQGIGGTRNCQWWFTDAAVLIDTAGRYTTQDSDRDADAKEWQGFLQLLKRFRPRQPINGVLLTASAADLLQAGPGETERLAAAARARLDELRTVLGVRFPVYLLVTKCDLLAGFVDFFDDLDRERREQIWGVTFDFDPARPDAPPPPLDGLLRGLGRRLHERLGPRLVAERSPARRASIFGFPSQFALLHPPLIDFVQRALGPSQLVATPILRGVYFTSGTQEGTPIDRLLGGLGRSMGLERAVLAPQQSTGKSFFLTSLLRDVVFAESALAGTNLAWERRRALLRGTIATVALGSVLAAGVAWTVSFLGNRDYVAEVGSQAATLGRTLSGASRDPREGLHTMLPVLDAVRSVAATPSVSPDAPPTSLGWGLFQGRKLDEAAVAAYRRMLADGLGPVISRRIEQQLRQPPATPEMQYETLKAYVMLHERDHLDPVALKAWIAFDAESRLGGTLDERARAALAAHVDELLARESVVPAAVYDAALVDRVRRTLAAAPFPQRVVDRIKRTGVPSDIAPFRITQAAGNAAQAVFLRVSGAPLTEPVPALYTYDGYHRGFQRMLDGLLAQLAKEETWVLGVRDSGNARRAADPALRGALADEVRAVYLREYAAVWERFVADLGLARSGALDQSIQLARALSAPDSPLPALLRAIVREVTLGERPDPGAAAAAAKGVVDKATEAVRSTQQELGRLLGQAAPAAGAAPARPAARVESIVDDRFDALRRFVRPAAPGQPAPIDATMQLIGDLYSTLIATQTAIRSGLPPPPSELPNRVRAEGGRLPEPVRSMLGSLSGAGTSQALAETREGLSQRMASTVGDFCTKALAGRYPFSPGSPRDVTPDDFAQLFAPGALLDDFFQKNLAPHVDTSTRPWSFRQQGDARMGGPSAALAQFQRAEQIRRTFFAGGARGPSFRFEVKPVSMDASILQLSLDVDGQVMRYAHGPVVPMSVAWPGPKGTGQIRLQAGSGAGGDAGFVVEGPWAPLRMIDRGRVEPSGVPERFRVAFDVGGRPVVLEITSGSVQSPFRLPDLQAFACPTRL